AQAPDYAFSAWLTTILLQFVVCVLPWWWGRYRMLRLARVATERQLIAEHARLRERARIAEDMHDQLGHDLALIALGSGALQVAPGATEAQRQTAAAVREQAAAAVERLHEIVAVLRADDAAPAREPADESVAELVERTRKSGVDIRWEHHPAEPGTPEPSPLARQAVHRVVQEALTNAAKYAPGGPVEVVLDDTGDLLHVSVRNSAAPGGLPTRRPEGQPGRGLTGVDERLAVLGGRLEAGPVPGGFSVSAQVPRTPTPTSAHAHRPAGHGPAAVSGAEHLAGTEVPVDGLRAARRRTRSLQLRSAILPLSLAAALALVMLVLQLVTVGMTALAPADYAAIDPGQTRGQLAPVLPASSMDGPTPLLAEPAVPAGARCAYYQARTDVFDFGPEMFRLCFRDDVLVSKDLLVPRRQP